MWVPDFAALNPGYVDDPSLHLHEAIVQRVAGAAHGADRVLLAAGVQKLAQAADMDVDGALVDINVAAPDAVEQLLAGKHPPGMLEEKFQQAIFGRTEIDRTARARDAALFAVEFDVAIGQYGGEPLRAGAAQQALHARQQFRHRERLDDVVVGAGGQAPHPLALLAARGQHDYRQLPRLRTRP